MVPSQRAEHVQLLLGHVAELEAVPDQVEAFVLEARRLQHLLDQQIHLGQLGLQDAGDRRDLLGRDRAVLEHRVIAAKHGQRAPELVRRKVQELGLRPLELDHAVGVLTQARRLRIALRVAALLRPVSLGQVARHLAETAQAACLVAERRDDHVGPEAGSVLADAPPLLLVPALALGDLELPIRLPVPGIVGRVEN